MSINIPNLDDRNYDQLYSEAMSVITRYYPDYAGMGLTDPAMVLAELFSYYFDVTSYQINRITQQTMRNFATLVGIQDEYEKPEELIRKALAEISSVRRAVTVSDIETIVMQETVNAARVFVLPGECIKVRVVAAKGKVISDTELRRIYTLLRGCSPLGTRYDVRNASMVGFNVMAEIVRLRNTTLKDTDLSKSVKNRLETFFSPFSGGDGNGWQLGRVISRSEIFSQIEAVAGVDYVATVRINRTGETSASDDELLLKPDELADLQNIEITIL